MSNKKRGKFQGDIWFQNKVEERMRTELRLLQAQGKMRDATLESLRGTPWYKAEFKRQGKLFKEKRRLQAEERTARQRAAAPQRQAEAEALAERDRAWAAEHENDTDDQLLDYLRQCAAELGHTPARREVPGGAYIGARFGNWAVALSMAGLPMPKKKRPRDTAVNAYLKRRQKAERAKHDSIREQDPDENKENENEREENDTDGSHRQGTENDRICKVD